MMRRKKEGYFKQDGGPAPIACAVQKTISFSDVDAMAIMWHGRYPKLFEMAAEALTKKIGLSYEAYANADLRAPIVQLHIDYHLPIVLEETVTIEAKMIWDDAARMNTQFRIVKGDGRLASTGYIVQMFTTASGMPCMIDPPLYGAVKEQWKQGAFACLTATSA
jgi:acyl-CoA thioester hydrolase